ncbi:hypothetical protein Droror1_Dr00018447 [Drosera rotundifolia]
MILPLKETEQSKGFSKNSSRMDQNEMANEDNIDELEQPDEQGMERNDQAEHPVPPDLATILRETEPVPRKGRTPKIHVGDDTFDYPTNTWTTMWKDGFGPRRVEPPTKNNVWSNVQHWHLENVLCLKEKLMVGMLLGVSAA